MIALAWFAFMVSLIGTLVVRRVFRKLSSPYALDAPQRAHAGQVSRLGGLGVLVGWTVGLASIPLLQLIHQAGNIAYAQRKSVACGHHNFPKPGDVRHLAGHTDQVLLA